MNRGYIIHAQNSSTVDYVECARVLCHSIKKHMPGESVTLLTDTQIVADEFDHVAVLPYGDQCVDVEWKLANDWQVLAASPYEYTIKLEADMVLPRRIDHWWEHLAKFDLAVCQTMRNYTGEISSSRYYRRAFDANKLPDLYNAITYFRKCKFSEEWFNLVREIFTNWTEWKALFSLPPTEAATTDLVYAIAAAYYGVERCTAPGFTAMSIVHMKPGVTGTVGSDWTKELVWELDSDTMRIQTIPQLWPLHYHNKAFASTLRSAEW